MLGKGAFYNNYSIAPHGKCIVCGAPYHSGVRDIPTESDPIALMYYQSDSGQEGSYDGNSTLILDIRANNIKKIHCSQAASNCRVMFIDKNVYPIYPTYRTKLNTLLTNGQADISTHYYGIFDGGQTPPYNPIIWFE